VVAEDTELAGCFVPARSELFLSIFHMHHDPEIFEEPRRFDPARWSKIKPSVYEYNPFSAGPRMCIGAAFAMMEIILVLATIGQRLRFSLVSERPVEIQPAMSLRPRDGIPVVVHNR